MVKHILDIGNIIMMRHIIKDTLKEDLNYYGASNPTKDVYVVGIKEDELVMSDSHSKIECPICDWDWVMTTDDDKPYLCHKCGFDSHLGDFYEKGLQQLEKQNQLPFQEQKEKKYLVRTFSESTSDDELVWHRDREDRIVKSLGNTNWLIQLDNELPRSLTEMVYIPKNKYHRLIKGDGELKVRLNKLI